mgnify:FL=1
MFHFLLNKLFAFTKYFGTFILTKYLYNTILDPYTKNSRNAVSYLYKPDALETLSHIAS